MREWKKIKCVDIPKISAGVHHDIYTLLIDYSTGDEKTIIFMDPICIFYNMYTGELLYELSINMNMSRIYFMRNNVKSHNGYIYISSPDLLLIVNLNDGTIHKVIELNTIFSQMVT